MDVNCFQSFEGLSMPQDIPLVLAAWTAWTWTWTAWTGLRVIVDISINEVKTTYMQG